MSTELFIRLKHVTMDAQPESHEVPTVPSNLTVWDERGLGVRIAELNIWGTPDEWDNLSRWAHECAKARRHS